MAFTAGAAKNALQDLVIELFGVPTYEVFGENGVIRFVRRTNGEQGERILHYVSAVFVPPEGSDLERFETEFISARRSKQAEKAACAELFAELQSMLRGERREEPRQPRDSAAAAKHGSTLPPDRWRGSSGDERPAAAGRAGMSRKGLDEPGDPEPVFHSRPSSEVMSDILRRIDDVLAIADELRVLKEELLQQRDRESRGGGR